MQIEVKIFGLYQIKLSILLTLISALTFCFLKCGYKSIWEGTCDSCSISTGRCCLHSGPVHSTCLGTTVHTCLVKSTANEWTLYQCLSASLTRRSATGQGGLAWIYDGSSMQTHILEQAGLQSFKEQGEALGSFRRTSLLLRLGI